jgi:hypothetical protein
MIERHESGGMTITGDDIQIYRLLTIRQGLRLEMDGLRITNRGSTCYAIARKEFGFRGNRAKVLAQLNDYIDCVTQARQDATQENNS